MTRRYAWILNLDAELELARGRPGYVPQRKLLSQLAEHGAGSKELLGPQDFELAADTKPLSVDERASVLGRAWCPTPMAIARIRECGIEPEPHPPAAVLRRVNHRLFAHELGGGLAQQAYVQSRAELCQKLGQLREPWLLKRPLSFAGRGQLRAISAVTDKQWTWIDASLKRDGLLVEPLVEPSFEVSLHGFVWPAGHFELGRICAQLVSERGVSRGVRVAVPGELTPEETASFLERAELVARALHVAGYFGPFGIDGYRYTHRSVVGFCALGEINARYTLGFVTGFPRHPSALSLG